MSDSLLSRPIPPIVPALLLAGFLYWAAHTGAFKSPGVPAGPTAHEPRVAVAGPVTSLAFSPDGRLLAAGHKNGTVAIREMPSGRVTRTLEARPEPARALAFSPDGKLLAVCADRIRLVDPVTGAVARALGPERQFCMQARFSADGRTLAAVGGNLAMWPVDGAGPGKRIEVPELFTTCAISPDLGLLATHHTNAVNLGIQLWDTRTGKLVERLPCLNWACDQLAFSPSGKLFGAGAYNSLIVWQLSGRVCSGPLRGHTDRIASLCFASDDRMVTAGVDGTLRLWDPRDRRALSVLTKVLDPPAQLAASPDGTRLAGGDQAGDVRLWELPK